jgi:hypothetical protein
MKKSKNPQADLMKALTEVGGEELEKRLQAIERIQNLNII